MNELSQLYNSSKTSRNLLENQEKANKCQRRRHKKNLQENAIKPVWVRGNKIAHSTEPRAVKTIQSIY